MAFTTVESTNDIALDHARAGDEGNLWIIAEQQTKGRGRHGRVWVSPRGNLYASLLLINPAPDGKKLTILPLVAALGLYRTVRGFIPMKKENICLKWPNDVLVNGAKLAGVLLETQWLKNNRLALVIGCGVNCETHPSNTLYPSTDLKSLGIDISPMRLFNQLSVTMEKTLDLWNKGKGSDAIRLAWLKAACCVGEKININCGERILRGIFSGIDKKGRLLLDMGNGEIKPVLSGDLFY